MPLWIPPTIAQQAEVLLTGWAVFEVTFPGDDELTIHFVGYSTAGAEGRVSSPIKAFDDSTRVGVSRSGRWYRLCGEPGLNSDGEYVWAKWVSMFDATVTRDCSARYVRETR